MNAGKMEIIKDDSICCDAVNRGEDLRFPNKLFLRFLLSH
jgi:hypothetical protein